MTKYIAVYGSLKRGFFNHRLIQDEKFIGATTLRKAKLYSLGSYPGIVSTENLNDKVHVEVFHVNNKETHRRIDWMEQGAGYKVVIKHFRIGNLKLRAKVYYYQYKVDESRVVTSGVWEQPQPLW